MDDRKINLVKNTTILALGNFSTKILSFLLVPLYTFYLKPSDYGKTDIYLTILSMLYILVSLQSIESSFRFIQDCETDRERAKTFSNAFVISLTGISIFSIVMFIIDIAFNFKFTTIFILYIMITILENLFLHTIRGMNKMTTYACIGVISTFIQFACNFIFIIGIKMGAISLLITPIITNFIIIIILIFTTNILNFIDFGTISLSVIKEQLKYSIPIIPNAIGIWLMSSIGRFILLFYYGSSEVGLLAFTLKFPMLLGTLNSIFFMAWQMSAIAEYNSNDKDKFASEVFHQYSKLLLSSILIILPLTKIIIFTVMGKSYVGTWMYIPLFFLGVIFNSYAQFFSMGFFSAKKTNEVFYSILISCIAYMLIGLILVKPLYIFGVGIAYSLVQLMYWLYIKIRVAGYIKIKVDVKSQILFLGLLCLLTIVYYCAGLEIQVIVTTINLFAVIFINRKLVVRVMLPIKRRFKIGF